MPAPLTWGVTGPAGNEIRHQPRLPATGTGRITAVGNARTRTRAARQPAERTATGTGKPAKEEETAIPAMNLDVIDAAELAELLQFLTGWIATDPARLAPSLLAYVGHPAYGLPQLRNDLDRFTFLLGGNDGESLFQPGPLTALRPPPPGPSCYSR